MTTCFQAACFSLSGGVCATSTYETATTDAVYSPWSPEFSLVDFQVQINHEAATDKSITGIQMGFCSLIDPTDHTLGCVERVPNYFRSTFYHAEETFNPFYPNFDYSYLSLLAVENLDRITRFTDSKIASIELCELSLAG